MAYNPAQADSGEQQYTSPALAEFFRKRLERDEARRAMYLKHDREALFAHRNQPRKLPKIGASKSKPSPPRPNSELNVYGHEANGIVNLDASFVKTLQYTQPVFSPATKDKVPAPVMRGTDNTSSNQIIHATTETIMPAIYTSNRARRQSAQHALASPPLSKRLEGFYTVANKENIRTPPKHSRHRKTDILLPSRAKSRTTSSTQPLPSLTRISADIDSENDSSSHQDRDDISDFGSSVDMQASPKLRLTHINGNAEYMKPLSPLFQSYGEPLVATDNHERVRNPMLKNLHPKSEELLDDSVFTGSNEVFVDTSDHFGKPITEETDDQGSADVHRRSPSPVEEEMSEPDESYVHVAEIDRSVTNIKYPVGEDDALHVQSAHETTNRLSSKNDENPFKHARSMSPLAEQALTSDEEHDQNEVDRTTGTDESLKINSHKLQLPMTSSHNRPTTDIITSTKQPKLSLTSDKTSKSFIPTANHQQATRRLINTAKPARAADDIAAIIANNDTSLQEPLSTNINKLHHSLAQIQESKQGIEALEARLSLATESTNSTRDEKGKKKQKLDNPIPVIQSSDNSNWIPLGLPKLWKRSSTARFGFKFTTLFWILCFLLVVGTIEDYNWAIHGYMPALAHWEPVDPTRPHWGGATVWVVKRYWKTHFAKPETRRRPLRRGYI